FNYDIETIQLRFLRILSEQASQNIIFNCGNTNIDILNHDVKLRTKNGMMYQMYSLSDDSLRYNIIKDECKYSHGQTILSISTNKSVRLPIIDIEFLNNFNRIQNFTINIGPVCFS
ncbi:unnamed protein product, partial [Rotaria sp. Silwood2]